MSKHELTADAAWHNNLCSVFESGEFISPRPGSKYTGDTLELVDWVSRVDMRFPVVTIASRKLGYRFMAAEAYWILTGDNRVSTIAPYSKVIANFSDNGETFHGAYGPMLMHMRQNHFAQQPVSQIDYVVQRLAEDQSTRQAVATIWRPCPPKSKDIPCTVSVQWLIRGGKIYCIDNMRSSDLWLGWPYDIFNFTMVTAVVALRLREVFGIHVTLGKICLHAGSQHLYVRDNEPATKCVTQPDVTEYAPFCLTKWSNDRHLMDFLKQMADNPSPDQSWLGELFRG